MAFWYVNRPEPAPDPLKVQVEQLTRSLESLNAQQQGTVDYLIQQSEEIETQFEKLTIEVNR